MLYYPQIRTELRLISISVRGRRTYFRQIKHLFYFYFIFLHKWNEIRLEGGKIQGCQPQVAWQDQNTRKQRKQTDQTTNKEEREGAKHIERPEAPHSRRNLSILALRNWAQCVHHKDEEKWKEKWIFLFSKNEYFIQYKCEFVIPTHSDLIDSPFKVSFGTSP